MKNFSHHEDKLARCSNCGEPFHWDENLIEVEEKDELYHIDCVKVFPIQYGVISLDDDWIGETEYEDGELAFMKLNKGEYKEDEENE